MSERRHRRSPAASSDSGPGGATGLVDDAAVAQEHDAVGPRRELRVVGDDDAGDAALRGGAQQAHDRLAVDRVERAGRLVGEQQPALADDRPGDRDPLALAAGELVGEAVGALGEAELLERLEPRRARGLGADAVELERQGDVLDRGEPGEQVEVLEHVADRAAPQPRPVVARHARRGRRRRRAPRRSVGSSRLPAMVSSVLLPEPLGPMIATSSPRSTDEVDVAQRVHLGRPGAVDLRHLAQFECAGHRETSIVRVGSSGSGRPPRAGGGGRPLLQADVGGVEPADDRLEPEELGVGDERERRRRPRRRPP